MKTIKDLKVGDICYLLDEDIVVNVKVADIKISMQTGVYVVKFILDNVECKPEIRAGYPNESLFYSVNRHIYLELEPIIKRLTIKAKSIQKEIERLKLKVGKEMKHRIFENYLEEDLIKVAEPGDYETAYDDYREEGCGDHEGELLLSEFIEQMKAGMIRYCERNDGIYYINDWAG